MALPVGSKAPDFSLKSKKGDAISDIRLADFAGKQNVVLFFFPLAFTGVCTTEMCDITAGLGSYDGLNAKVIAISVDSPFAQDAWASKEKIGITLASDLGGKVATAYGTLLADLGGFGPASARAAFVINKEGVIQYSEQTPTPKELPNFDAVKAKLAELQ
ncbi:MAG TPA: redoxin domain-containing protein [Chthoniobacteraceae bacterium]|jgi:peroxiredoxin|nr:redoxin domain-containing protein [Chthoniobacteraceae bacterium]